MHAGGRARTRACVPSCGVRFGLFIFKCAGRCVCSVAYGTVCEVCARVRKRAMCVRLPAQVVGKWVADTANPYLPIGSYSWGVWPLGSHECWGAYRIHRPDHTLVKYRFDVLWRVSVGPADTEAALHVSFHDLLLDVTVNSDGGVEMEDECEVAAALEAGALSQEQRGVIDRTRRRFQTESAAIVRSVDDWIAMAEASAGHPAS